MSMNAKLRNGKSFGWDKKTHKFTQDKPELRKNSRICSSIHKLLPMYYWYWDSCNYTNYRYAYPVEVNSCDRDLLVLALLARIFLPCSSPSH